MICRDAWKLYTKVGWIGCCRACMSNSCSSPTPVAVLNVKGQTWGELEEHQTKRHIQF